ncbi:ABC transporter permease [Megalodesulfovibrio gigas]|nr:ABC transporter permease [Megalodesulfovibrio gigas]
MGNPITLFRIFFRILGMAGGAVGAFRMRTLFVACAVALGIASLTLIVAAVDGADKQARDVVARFGVDAALIFGGDMRAAATGQRTLTLTWRDAETLRDSLPGAYLVIPMRSVNNRVTLRAGNRNMDLPTLVGSTANYALAWDWPLAEGRDLREEDVRQAAKVALIGETIAKLLFPGENPLGKTIFANNLPVQIVGRLAERGGTSGGGTPIDSRAVIPLSTLTQRFNLDRTYFRALRIKFHNPELMDTHMENVRSLLRHLHKLKDGDPDDFTIISAAEILKFLSMLQGSLVAFLGVTATVSLLVGGFVLANLFYLSVRERQQEVGLKRAMGAKSWHITLQFLAEAVALTLLGAVLGVGLGVGLGEVLTRYEILTIVLSWKIGILALAASLTVGVVFGLKPARNAAQLHPIEALRGG